MKEVSLRQLTPWRKPSRHDITRFNRELDSLWNNFFGEIQPFERLGEEWFPLIDVNENNTEINVRAELPGIKAKDINLNISGDILTIRGKKKEKEEKEQRKYCSRECYFGAFQRSICCRLKFRTIRRRPSSKTVF
jgi:HSP20 family protein